MIVNDNLDAGSVHDQRFAEQAGLAYKHAAALAQGTIDGFDDARSTAAFGTEQV